MYAECSRMYAECSRVHADPWACMLLHKLACSYISLHTVPFFVWAAHKNFAVLVSTFCSSSNLIVTLSADLLRQIAFSNLHCDKCFNLIDWSLPSFPQTYKNKSQSIIAKRMWNWNNRRLQSHPIRHFGKINLIKGHANAKLLTGRVTVNKKCTLYLVAMSKNVNISCQGNMVKF